MIPTNVRQLPDGEEIVLIEGQATPRLQHEDPRESSFRRRGLASEGGDRAPGAVRFVSPPARGPRRPHGT
jgi:hypothetical protein